MRRVAAAMLLVIFWVGATGISAAAQESTAQVTVVHAFRGLVADVYLDGQRQLEGFAPERLAGPLTLPAGPHEVAVYRAGEGPPAPPVLGGTVQIEAGTNVSAVVHPGEDGQPRLSLFANDLNQLPAGSGRLVVRHTAASGPVDVLLNDAPVAQAVGSGSETAQQVAAGGYKTAVVAGGQPVLPPTDVSAPEGQSTILYLIGASGSLGWLAQTVEGQQMPPSGVPTGTSGLADPNGANWAVLVPALLGLLLGAAILLQRRAKTERS